MPKFFIFCVILFVFDSCQSTTKTEANTPIVDTSKISNLSKSQNLNLLDTNQMKQWITKTIEHEINRNNGNDLNSNEEAEGNALEIYSEDYKLYKSDAMNVGYDEGMTQDVFVKKWQSKYNPKLAGQGMGFLISGQDNGLVDVPQCHFIHKNSKNQYVFKTIIQDKDNKIQYHRDICVIVVDSHFLIDDILEYD